MLAGFAATDITPPIGSPLNGFIARLTPSTGIDAPLAARALWLEDRQTQCLIVAVDVLGLSTAVADRVVQGLAMRLDVPESRIVLASTHTHSGPMSCRLRGLGPADEAYLAVLESRIYEAAGAAADEQAAGPGVLGRGAGRDRSQSPTDRPRRRQGGVGLQPGRTKGPSGSRAAPARRGILGRSVCACVASLLSGRRAQSDQSRFSRSCRGVARRARTPCNLS